MQGPRHGRDMFVYQNERGSTPLSFSKMRMNIARGQVTDEENMSKMQKRPDVFREKEEILGMILSG